MSVVRDEMTRERKKERERKESDKRKHESDDAGVMVLW